MTTWAIHNDPPLDVCVRVLAEAFAEEPAVVWLCGNDPRRRAAWFDALLQTHAGIQGRRIVVTQDGQPVGVAVATAPGCKPETAAQAAWTVRTLRRCGPRALAGTLAYFRHTEAWKPIEAWTLELVGVLPQARGNGLARHLCERAQADHPEAPAFLTTADPENVGLYERWGFDAFVSCGLTGMTVVGMIRPVRRQKEHKP